MDENSSKSAEQATAFQKIWLESMSKLLQTVFTYGTESPPPEVLRQIRSGIFQALAKSWEEFMGSPQFLDGMRQWMDHAVTFRKMTNEFMANVRNEMQAPSRDDIDTIMLAVRHMEKRLLDRIEELSAQVDALKVQAANQDAVRKTVKTKSASSKPTPKPSRGKREAKSL